MQTSITPAVKMVDITKLFGDKPANEDVSVTINRGTVHAIVGENGAGKSTLVKVLYGYHKPDSGQIYINGKKVVISNSEQAIGHGIGMVHQTFMLIEAMTVLDNIVLGHPTLKANAVIDYKQALQNLNSLAKTYNFKFDFNALVRDLEVGTKQRLEIFKTIYREADILILDEPTSVLTKLEVQDLFRIIQKIKSQNKTVIIITHKLNEVMEIADNVTVMRAAKVVGERKVKDSTIEELAGLMVGRKIVTKTKEKIAAGDDVLVIKDLTYQSGSKKILDKINLKIGKKEIVGIAGVSGNGQAQLEQVLAGMITSGLTGEIIYHGQNILTQGTAKRRNNGFAHIPSDRLRWGYVSDWSNYQNFALGYQFKEDYNLFGYWLNFAAIKKAAQLASDKFRVTPIDVDYRTKELSGGNQQKFIVGREMESFPEFIIVAEPTQGVDIGSVAFIHEKILEAKAAGKAILLISSELDEIKDLSDRSFVICGGKIVDEIDWEKDDEKSIGIKMIGGQEIL